MKKELLNKIKKLNLESDRFVVRFMLETEKKIRSEIIECAKEIGKSVVIRKQKSLLVVELQKRVICTYHDLILEECLEIFKIVKEKEIIKRIEKIQYAVLNAKDAGVKMENRLREYKNSILDLGFVRKK